MKYRAYLSIGEVLGLLVDEFPDVTISKIRFLETQGLVEPERTASGYRKFSDEHVERLRYVMREQKDNYLPLKVIKDRLDGEDGTPLSTPRPLPTGAAWANIDAARTAQHAITAATDQTVTFTELLINSGTTAVDLVEVRFEDSPLRPLDDATGVEATHHAAKRHDDESLSIDALAAVPDAGAATVDSGAVDPVAADNAAAIDDMASEGSELDTDTGTGPIGVDPSVGVVENSRSPVAEMSADSNAAAEPAVLAPTVKERGHAERTPLRTVANLAAPAAAGNESWTAEEITAETGASTKLLDELVSYGLIRPHVVGGTTTYDGIARQIAVLAVELASHGLEVRHLRVWRTNAEKETALFEQLILPLVRQRNPQARQQTVVTLSTLCDLGADLRAALVHSELKPYLD